MTLVHISRVEEKTPWRNTPYNAGDVVTHCCHCRMPPRQTHYRKLVSFGGYIATQQVYCKPGFGCDKNPRRKIGMWNRPCPQYED